MMAQTIILKDRVYFNVYVPGEEEIFSYKAPNTFKFRGYNMLNIAETDFYNLTTEEITEICRACRRNNE